MWENFISEDLVSLDDIDTSEIECDGCSDDDSDFYDSFDDESLGFDFSSEEMDMDEPELSSLEDTDESGASNTHLHKEHHSSEISFTGNGRCRVCGCGQWAGFGDTCENCGHFYNKHI